jgi:glycosidase
MFATGFQTGDDSSERFAGRFNATFINAFTILTFLMPGTPLVFYGDEINMVNTGAGGDLWTRDQPNTRIMRWSNTTNGGFCNDTCNPWTTISDVSSGNIEVSC